MSFENGDSNNFDNPANLLVNARPGADASGSYRWVRTSSRIFTLDHRTGVLGAFQGARYAYADASFGNEGDQAVISIKLKAEIPALVLRFPHTLNGRNVGSLSVSLIRASQVVEQLWEESGSGEEPGPFSGGWKNFFGTAGGGISFGPYTDAVALEIIATRGDGDLGDITIDSLRLEPPL